MRKGWILVGLLGALAACGGGNDKWIDVPMMPCSELEKDDESVTKDVMSSTIGPSVCLQARGLNYADDFRCENDRVQVLCKEP